MKSSPSIAPPVPDVGVLEELLSEPTPEVVETLRRLDGDIMFLGVAGKMGPTLARMAKRASDLAGVNRRVIGVSRFSSPHEKAKLQAHGIETIACDLLDTQAVRRLPDAPNVVYMAGMKFGSTGNESATWAMNAYLPAAICETFSGSRIVAFSTGNVYGLVEAAGRGARESDPLNPVGEYAMSCLARERMFEYFSRKLGIPVTLIRLNYACELRYGVLVDIAHRVWSDAPVDTSMGCFNIIWQGDANAMTLRAFDHVSVPPFVLNVTGPECVSIREAATTFGRLMTRDVTFTGAESQTALLSDGSRAMEFFGAPRVGLDQLIAWIADWISRGGPTLGKPTHFESRDGRF